MESFEHVTTVPLLCSDTNSLIHHPHFRHLPFTNHSCLRIWQLRHYEVLACASRHFFLSFLIPHRHGDSDYDSTHEYFPRALEGHHKHVNQTRA